MRTFNFKYLAIIALFSCTNDKKLENDNRLVESIKQHVISGQSTLNLEMLTDFQWDSLLLLTPYSQVDSVEKQKKVDLSSIKPSSIEYSDAINQLIFFDSGASVRMIEYPRYPGDFAGNKVEFIRRNEARFEILVTDQKTSDGKRWIELKKAIKNINGKTASNQ